MHIVGVEFAHSWQDVVASALDWWQEAGLDTLTQEAPRDWLAAAAPVAVPSSAAPIARGPAFPATIEAFAAWRVGTEAPEAGWNGRAVPAAGPLTPPLMVVIDCPDRDDEGEARLLSGAAGRLFDRMLAAIGLSREAVYVASLAAKRPIAGRIAESDSALLADILRHHISLVSPKRLLILGGAASRALIGADVAAVRGDLQLVNHPGGKVGAVASFHPRVLLERPAAKPEAWKDLQLLIGGTGA